MIYLERYSETFSLCDQIGTYSLVEEKRDKEFIESLNRFPCLNEKLVKINHAFSLV